jgi:HYDIN/CFA65/VesB family protein
MFHKDIPRDARGRVRPDLRAQALRDWSALPVEGGYVWRSVGPAEGLDPGDAQPPPPPPDTAPPLAGGLISDLAIGASLDQLAIATRNGGIWRTTNGGTDWQPQGDGLPSLQTVTVAMVASGAGEPILLAGTGDLNNEQIRATGLVGLYRSVDGGRTWSVADGGADATLFRSHDTNEVVAIDAGRILVATRIGLYFSKDGGRSFGDDVEHRNGRPMLRGPVGAVVVEGTEVAAVIGGEPTARPELFSPELDWQTRTPPGDPGLWLANLSATGLGAFRLVHATRDLVTADTVGNSTLARRGTALLLSAAQREVPLDTLAEVLQAFLTNPHHSIQFSSGNPATSRWHLLPASGSPPVGVEPRQTQYVHSLALEPLRTGRAAPDAWFGSVDLFRAEIRLASGRFLWAPAQRGAGKVHADQHVVKVAPRSGSSLRVLVGNDGGFYRSDDSGGTWQSFNRHGSILFWTLIGARRDASTLRLMGGLQDNGSVVGEGPTDPASPTQWRWQRLPGGDGGSLAWLPADRDHFPVQDPGTAFITVNGSIRKATGTDVLRWTPPADEFSPPDGFPFSETVVIARGPAGAWDRHYFTVSGRRNGPGSLFVRDGGGAFTARQTFTALVTAMAAAPADAATERSTSPGEWSHLWIGLANGEVLFSQDAGQSFFPQAVSGTGPVTGIAVDPDDSRRVAVVFGGFSDRGRAQTTARVFLTENGATFRDISGRRGPDGFVPDLPVLAVTFARTNPVALVIATDLGVLITTGPQLGQRWSRLGVGLPTMYCPAVAAINTPPVDPVPALSAGLPPIAVATFGRGAYLLARPAAAEAVLEFDGGFGAVRVGSAERRTLTVRNPGGAVLDVTHPIAPAPFSFEGLPTAPIRAAARGSVSWTVVCRPTAAGVQIANLSLTIGGAARDVPVSCEAVAGGPPRLALWPRSVNFGVVPDGQTGEETIHLKNTGAGDLHVSGIAAGADASPRLTLTPAVPPSLQLAPGEERTLTLRFAATGRNTNYGATWTITCDDPIPDVEHFELAVEGSVGEPLPDSGGGGTPLWVWFAVAGGAVVVGAVVVILYYES